MSDNIQQKMQHFLEKQEQTQQKMFEVLLPNKIGEWVMQRAQNEQSFTLNDLQQWAEELAQSSNIVLQQQGQALLRWLASLSKTL